MGVQVDRYRNEARGTRGTAKESLYFGVDGSGGNTYDGTLNYDTGHWCSCRGMTSKVSKFGAVGRLDPRNAQHWCKHVAQMRSPGAFELRIEARRIRNECFGIHEAPTDPETGKTVDEVQAPAPVVSNRRQAVQATQAANKSAADRLAEIESEREALLREIADTQKGVNTAVASLVSDHGIAAVKVAIKKAS